MMKVCLFPTAIVGLIAGGDAFVHPSTSSARTSIVTSRISILLASKQDDAKSTESEAERFLRMARKLREQAEQEEQQVHTQLHSKKTAEDQQLDHWIKELLGHGKGTTATVDQLHEKRPSMETLEHVVDRLHERHIIAGGQEHVRAEISTSDAAYERVTHTKDEEEADRLIGLVESLLAAVQVLDEELQHEKKGAPIAHTESQHWGGDQKAQQLNNRWRELRREHEEQFLIRQESFVEAQRRKKDRKPPPKVKDDHGLLP
jgi:hypothetical protein